MNLRSILFAGAICATLTGCISTGKVIQLDSKTYMVNSSSSGTVVSYTDMLEKSATKAEEFCRNKGLQMEHVADGQSGRGPFNPRRDATFTFTCR